MLLLSKIYIFLYFFYSYFGYNCLNRLIENKKIDYALLDYRAYAFVGKRICMLSHIAFLYSAYFLENPSFNTYINIIFLHSIVNIGYFLKWGVSEITTFILHIYWALPVSFYGYFLVDDFYFYKINIENFYLINFLFFYLFIFDYIYTPRIEYIDNPA